MKRTPGIMTRYTDISDINVIVKRRAVAYHQNHDTMYSAWYYENRKDNGQNLVICSNYPGIWIGKAGCDIDALKKEVNDAIDHRNKVLSDAYAAGRLSFKPDLVLHMDVKLIEVNF